MTDKTELAPNGSSDGIENNRTNDTANLPAMSTQDDASRRLLIEDLQRAAQVEHSLLNSYLYTACSIKTMPGEFEKMGDRDGNLRAGIQFERARQWKRNILFVAHEEMAHLHYVQCMLRGLGEKPYFKLPERNKNGHWTIPNWETQIPGKQEPVQIPIEPLTSSTIENFVLYESTDALQGEDLFQSEELKKLFEKLFEFEVSYDIEASLYNVKDDATRQELFNKLFKLYTTQCPFETASLPPPGTLPVPIMPPVRDVRFASVADLYLQRIAPSYSNAFKKGWVIQDNKNLVGEITTELASEGALPIGPVYRTKNFEKRDDHNVNSSFTDFKTVEEIIQEIVDEGEGFAKFKESSEDLLKTAKNIGTHCYLKAYLDDKAAQQGTTTKYDWLVKGQQLRKSHLHQFIVIMMGLRQENDLAQAVNVTFEAYRQPADIGNNMTLNDFTDELPCQFNACYLVTIMWLSRMYEWKEWEADKPRRVAIEMLVSWPLMSLAIRPFLELASFFPIEKTKLFAMDMDKLPPSPSHARQLLQLYLADQRSEKINEQLDTLGLKTLTNAAAWASDKIEPISKSELLSGQKEMIITRLKALTTLSEFEKQFCFRVHGGYSDTPPDVDFRNTHPNSDRYEEDPIGHNFESEKFFKNALILRLRFSGWGLVQLATDPDPPTDEAGCSGTIMLQPSDGKGMRMNRALVWQKHADDPTEFARGPPGKVPEVGVNCVDISLMVAGADVKVEKQALTNPLNPQSYEINITGLTELFQLTPAAITGDASRKVRIDLRSKNNFKPLLLGENHLVWRAGEPIDPFVLAVLIDIGAAGQQSVLAFSREVYNEDKRLIEMEPYERLLSFRSPFGLDSDFDHVPDWAKQNLSQKEKELIFDSSQYPTNYLENRAHDLEQALSAAFHNTSNQPKPEDINTIVSLASRMNWITLDPRGSVHNWLKFLLHYGHSLSGSLKTTDSNPILETLHRNTGLSCTISAAENRNETNARWLVKYCKGIMDADALSDFMFGELYIPLAITAAQDRTIRLFHSWPPYDKRNYDTIRRFALNFYHAFWRHDYTYDQSKKTRILKVDNMTNVIETLTSEDKKESADSCFYTYSQMGFHDIDLCSQTIKLNVKDALATLSWSIEFSAENEKAVINMVLFFGDQIGRVDNALQNAIQPSTHD